MRGTALIHQASALTAAGRPAEETKSLVVKAEEAFAKAAELSGGRMKTDHLTLAMFYESKGEPGFMN
jgi:hypothetical protein